MSYKVGLILSMIFVSLFFLFGADLLTLESVYSSLDAKANNISYLISRTGVIDQDFIMYIQDTFRVVMICAEDQAPAFGDKIVYQISTTFHPLIISKDEMTISIQRMTIIGFYG